MKFADAKTIKNIYKYLILGYAKKSCRRSSL